MARLTTVLLCDFAQVREGLLFVASGGVTRLFREVTEQPVPMGVYLALVVELQPDELELAHEMKVTVKRLDTAEIIASATVGFQLPPGAVQDIEPGESLQVPYVVPLQNAGLPAMGAYDVNVAVDSGVATTLTFYVVKPPG